jgi:hypothetical protein
LKNECQKVLNQARLHFYGNKARPNLNHTNAPMRHSYLPALLLSLLMLSCNTPTRYPYAIKDFRVALRPELEKAVIDGVVGHLYNTSGEMINDQELVKLSRCEHPVLRAAALREMLERETFNHADVVMSHLDDTAEVLIDNGEFGLGRNKISDDLVWKSMWKTHASKEKAIEKIIIKHNYLTAAYQACYTLAPQERFYPFIKDMASRPKQLEDGYEMEFDDIEYALYGLAKFRKAEDISLIKSRLMDNTWKMSWVSFKLMRKFHDTAWFEVLQKYYRQQFYQFKGNRRGGFSGVVEDRANPEEFIDALVAQRTPKSASILEAMLKQLPEWKCFPDREDVIEYLKLAIWDSPCPAYEQLRNKVKSAVDKISNNQKSWYRTSVVRSPVDSVIRKVADSDEENIWW